MTYQSHWPRGVRRESAVSCLPGVCQVEVSASGCSLPQRSPTECGVCECDREAPTVRSPWYPRGYHAIWGAGRKEITKLNQTIHTERWRVTLLRSVSCY
jgi:hypothetical protein